MGAHSCNSPCAVRDCDVLALFADRFKNCFSILASRMFFFRHLLLFRNHAQTFPSEKVQFPLCWCRCSCTSHSISSVILLFWNNPFFPLAAGSQSTFHAIISILHVFSLHLVLSRFSICCLRTAVLSGYNSAGLEDATKQKECWIRVAFISASIHRSRPTTVSITLNNSELVRNFR